jgi:Glycosyl transferases group 1
MKLFQNINLYPEQIVLLNSEIPPGASFRQRIETILRLGLNGTHILHPVIQGGPDAFLTSTTDPDLQRQWSIENNLPANTHPHEVLVAQLKAFKPDLFYTHSAGKFPNHVRQILPSLCKINVCWKGPPDYTAGVNGFNLLVNNFPSSLPRYEEEFEIKTGHLTPSFDPAMEPMCYESDRRTDIVFVGSYSRHHRYRAQIIEALSCLSSNHSIKFFLLFDKATRIGNTPLGLLPGLSKYRVPKTVMKLSTAPVFGTNMYRQFSNAKIVVNCAIDVAGNDRGNIRCFEAMGCGALLVSDEGHYPVGMENGTNMLTYSSVENLIQVLKGILANESERRKLALAGLNLARGQYGKLSVWNEFKRQIALKLT